MIKSSTAKAAGMVRHLVTEGRFSTSTVIGTVIGTASRHADPATRHHSPMDWN
ncbi:hypothetical protein ACX80D_04745 [Arthrobacter sp. Sr24]